MTLNPSSLISHVDYTYMMTLGPICHDNLVLYSM